MTWIKTYIALWLYTNTIKLLIHTEEVWEHLSIVYLMNIYLTSKTCYSTNAYFCMGFEEEWEVHLKWIENFQLKLKKIFLFLPASLYLFKFCSTIPPHCHNNVSRHTVKLLRKERWIMVWYTMYRIIFVRFVLQQRPRFQLKRLFILNLRTCFRFKIFWMFLKE